MTDFFLKEEAAKGYHAYNDILEQILGYRSIFSFLAQMNEDSTILDYGCGPGKISYRIAERFPLELISVDISKEMLKIAQDHHNHDRITYHLLEKNENHLSFLEDESVDATICCFVFLTISSLEQVKNRMTEIYRVMKPGSTFMILETNPNTAGYEFSTCIHGEKGKPYKDGDRIKKRLKVNGSNDLVFHDYYWTQDTITDALTQAGFTDVTIEEPMLKDLSMDMVSDIERKHHLQWKNDWKMAPFILYKAVR